MRKNFFCLLFLASALAGVSACDDKVIEADSFETSISFAAANTDADGNGFVYSGDDLVFCIHSNHTKVVITDYDCEYGDPNDYLNKETSVDNGIAQYTIKSVESVTRRSAVKLAVTVRDPDTGVSKTLKTNFDILLKSNVYAALRIDADGDGTPEDYTKDSAGPTVVGGKDLSLRIYANCSSVKITNIESAFDFGIEKGRIYSEQSSNYRTAVGEASAYWEFPAESYIGDEDITAGTVRLVYTDIENTEDHDESMKFVYRYPLVCTLELMLPTHTLVDAKTGQPRGTKKCIENGDSLRFYIISNRDDILLKRYEIINATTLKDEGDNIAYGKNTYYSLNNNWKEFSTENTEAMKVKTFDDGHRGLDVCTPLNSDGTKLTGGYMVKDDDEHSVKLSLELYTKETGEKNSVTLSKTFTVVPTQPDYASELYFFDSNGALLENTADKPFRLNYLDIKEVRFFIDSEGKYTADDTWNITVENENNVPCRINATKDDKGKIVAANSYKNYKDNIISIAGAGKMNSSGSGGIGGSYTLLFTSVETGKTFRFYGYTRERVALVMSGYRTEKGWNSLPDKFTFEVCRWNTSSIDDLSEIENYNTGEPVNTRALDFYQTEIASDFSFTMKLEFKSENRSSIYFRGGNNNLYYWMYKGDYYVYRTCLTQTTVTGTPYCYSYKGSTKETIYDKADLSISNFYTKSLCSAMVYIDDDVSLCNKGGGGYAWHQTEWNYIKFTCENLEYDHDLFEMKYFVSQYRGVRDEDYLTEERAGTSSYATKDGKCCWWFKVDNTPWAAPIE